MPQNKLIKLTKHLCDKVDKKIKIKHKLWHYSPQTHTLLQTWSLAFAHSKTKISASANALKLCQRDPDPMESFFNIHVEANRATPEFFSI